MPTVMDTITRNLAKGEAFTGLYLREGDSDNFTVPLGKQGILLPPSDTRFLAFRNAPARFVAPALDSPYIIFTSRGTYIEQGDLATGHILFLPHQYGFRSPK